MKKEMKTVFSWKEIPIRIPEENITTVLQAHNLPPLKSPEKALMDLLEDSIGSKKLVDLVKPGCKVVIVTSEYMRMSYT